MTDWEALYASLEIEPPRHGAPIGKPPDEAFLQFEKETSFTLPDDYKAFLKTFGPGTAGGFRILAPGYPGLHREFRLMTRLNRWRTLYSSDDHNYPTDLERCRRLILFADSDDNIAGWDPLDVRDGSSHEYGIRVRYHEPNDNEETKFAAATFAEFIERVCYGNWWDEAGGVDPLHWEVPERKFYPVAQA